VKEEVVGLFTVELEIGRETRAMIERIAADAREMIERRATTGAIELEFGPQTREVMAHLFESRDSSVREKIGGMVGKASGG
jgi:hypothetical protein